MRWLAAVVLLTGCGRFGFSGDPDADPDAAVPAPDAVDLACDPRPLPGVVALFDFDDAAAPFADTTGAHTGSPRGNPMTVPGPCGAAIGFATPNDYIVVPDAPAYDLAEGAIELYARVDVFGDRRGLISRDANGTPVSGHFSAAVNAEGIPFVRMQLTGGLDFYRCGDEPVALGAWFHLAASFGPPGMTLWIDGVAQTTRATIPDTNGEPTPCQTPHAEGIAGPDDPWVIGALEWTTTEGGTEPTIINALADGAIDHVRIHDAWIDFTAP